MDEPYIRDVLVAYKSAHAPSQSGVGAYIFEAVCRHPLDLLEVKEIQRNLGYPPEGYGCYQVEYEELKDSLIGGVRVSRPIYLTKWHSMDSSD